MKTRHFCFLLFVIAVCGTSSSVCASDEVPASGWHAIDVAPSAPGDFERELRVRQQYDARVAACVMGLPQHLRQQLPKGRFVISIYDPVHGGTRMTGITEKEMARTDALEVVLYGAATAAQDVLPASFHYNPEWGAIFVPAVHMNDTWFCAAFTHEFFHAETHATDISESTDERVMEEVRAHQMEREFLDAKTNGAYRSALARTLKGETGVNLTRLLTKVEMVNAIFPPAQSDVELSVRWGQIYFDLAFLALEPGYCVSEREKIDLYLALRKKAMGEE